VELNVTKEQKKKGGKGGHEASHLHMNETSILAGAVCLPLVEANENVLLHSPVE
jgi:hypothetical protein